VENIIEELREDFLKDSSKPFLALAEHLIEDKNYTALKEVVSAANELAIIDTMNHLSTEEKAILYRLLSKDKALRVFEQLDMSDQHRLITSFTEDAAIAIIKELEPDDRVRLMDELPAKVTKRMLSSLSPEQREMTNLLMGFEEGTAGRTMTPLYVRIKRNMTVAQAMEKVKRVAKDMETVYTIYVTDEKRKLEGVLSLRELIVADDKEKIENIMNSNVTTVNTCTPQEDVARTLQKLSVLALPVVDMEDLLVGIVTVDDAMDILEDEATDTILDTAGLTGSSKNSESSRSETLIRGSFWKIWRIRLPFLLLTLVGGLLAGSVIGFFEDTLESILAVAIFIPVIMDMGGSVGTQSSTIFARGVVLEHINTKRVWRHIGKEVIVGLSMGLIAGITCGLVAFIWQGMWGLGLAVGLSVMFTMTLASLMGFLIPFLMLKLNVDQAAATAPIITTVKDVTGLFIYFGFVALFLGHLL